MNSPIKALPSQSCISFNRDDARNKNLDSKQIDEVFIRPFCYGVMVSIKKSIDSRCLGVLCRAMECVAFVEWGCALNEHDILAFDV